MQTEDEDTPKSEYTTAQVAERLSMKRNTISQLIWRVEALKPKKIIPPGTFLWSEDEVNRLIEYRTRRKKTTQ